MHSTCIWVQPLISFFHVKNTIPTPIQRENDGMGKPLVTRNTAVSLPARKTIGRFRDQESGARAVPARCITHVYTVHSNPLWQNDGDMLQVQMALHRHQHNRRNT